MILLSWKESEISLLLFRQHFPAARFGRFSLRGASRYISRVAVLPKLIKSDDAAPFCIVPYKGGKNYLF